jgi:hypothetical protein
MGLSHKLAKGASRNEMGGFYFELLTLQTRYAIKTTIKPAATAQMGMRTKK